MKFRRGQRVLPDGIGGLPSHLPSDYPMDELGRPLAFLAEFRCTPERLFIPGVICIQVYQRFPSNRPEPIVFALPVGSRQNTEGLGQARPDVIAHDIEWESREDPDAIPPDYLDSACNSPKLGDSKAGGVVFYEAAVDPGETFLLQLREQPANLDFGGWSMVIVRRADGVLEARLG